MLGRAIARRSEAWLCGHIAGVGFVPGMRVRLMIFPLLSYGNARAYDYGIINGSLRDELLNGDIFYSFAEARVLIKVWRSHDNTV